MHRVTQDDDGEYEYREQVLDEVDTYDDNDEVTQGNIVDKHTNNQTSVQDDTKDHVGRNNSGNTSQDQEQSTKGKFLFVKNKSDFIVKIIFVIATCETFVDHTIIFKGNHIIVKVFSLKNKKKFSDVFGPGNISVWMKLFAYFGRETRGDLSRC